MAKSFLKMQDERHVRRMEIKRRADLEKYVHQVDGKIGVNWRRLVDDNQKSRFNGNGELDIYHDLLSYLRIKGVLTFQSKGSFFVFGEGMDLSPSTLGVLYHFTRKQDAREFAKAEYSGAMYGVRVGKTLTNILNPRKN